MNAERGWREGRGRAISLGRPTMLEETAVRSYNRNRCRLRALKGTTEVVRLGENGKDIVLWYRKDRNEGHG